MNKKKIVNSVLISFLVLMSLYFVIGGGIIEGDGKQTFYNVSDAAGNIEGASAWWNINTNYTVNFSGAVAGNSRALYFNFTINHTNVAAAAVKFSGNITNVTINFTDMFEVATAGAASNSTCDSQETGGFIAIRTGVGELVFHNKTNGGLTNRSGDSGLGFDNCTFWVNVSVNGTGLRGANAALETTGSIIINASNSSRTGSTVLTFTVGVDARAPRVTTINVTDGTVVYASTALAAGNSAFFNNDSNFTVSATISDANINKTGNATTGNVTIWYNFTGAATIGMGSNSTNMTLGTCFISAGVESCSYSAVISNLFGGRMSVGRNVSFIIVAADYFGQTGNDTNSQKGYNFTIRNTASVPQITVPTEKIIVFRDYAISCDGDTNSTIVTETGTGTTICQGANACAGTFTPTTSGAMTIQCLTTDAAGNQQLATQDINVYSRSSTTGSSSGGSSSGTVTPTPTAMDISKEASTAGLRAGDLQPFTYDAASHTMKVDSVGSGTVTVTIDDKVTTTLEPAKSVEIDITGDGSKDVKLTLNKITLNKADITLEMLAGATSTPTEEQTTQGKSSLTWLWVMLGIVVIAGVIWAIIAMKKK
ncbi:MAG: hypothetical protein WC413_00170 [Candidatus Nanoarchaeia archaeon]